MRIVGGVLREHHRPVAALPDLLQQHVVVPDRVLALQQLLRLHVVLGAVLLGYLLPILRLRLAVGVQQFLGLRAHVVLLGLLLADLLLGLGELLLVLGRAVDLWVV